MLDGSDSLWYNMLMKYDYSNAPIWIEDAHELSANLARAYAIAYAKDKDSRYTETLFEMYKDSRRAIPRATNGHRFGAYEAYCARDTYTGA